MIANVLTLLATASLILLLSLPKVRNAKFWRATITPLASIIGSGFLIIGPILDHAFGGYAPFAMLALCIVSYFFGSAIRETIRFTESGGSQSTLAAYTDTAASWTLAVAYIISVTYYLNLFGAFSVRMTPWNTDFAARVVTSVMLALVLIVGWWKGFTALERMEQASVTLKLAIIGGLLVGLGFFFLQKTIADDLTFNLPTLGAWESITLLFGLIVAVQGFETSRYLGNTYDARTRVRSMQFAQVIAFGIYMTYILLMTFTFKSSEIALEETAIIDMMRLITPILPPLLIAAALSAQFSAAIADTGGCGGLIDELSDHKFVPKQAYAVITLAGIALTWFADVFEIISYASRAFAAYYALQAALAALNAWQGQKNPLKAGLFGALALLGFAMAFLGQAVE
jgi:hypothetical protein